MLIVYKLMENCYILLYFLESDEILLHALVSKIFFKQNIEFVDFFLRFKN